MSEAADQELAERARKLFAGPIEFLKSAPGLQFLPDADAPEIAFAGVVQIVRPPVVGIGAVVVRAARCPDRSNHCAWPSSTRPAA